MSLPFTPQDVIEAYEKTGLQPVAEWFTQVIDNIKCGCALTALYVSKADDQSAAFTKIHCESDVHGIISKSLEFDELLLLPFVSGFDGVNYEKNWEGNDDFRAAYTLGVDTRNAVDEHFAKGPDET